MDKSKTVLVIGATGYIGARLVPRLLNAGYRVRAASRSLDKLLRCTWAGHENLELVSCDVMNLQELNQAMHGCEVAYYFVHSMNSQHKNFAEADRRGAHNMVAAAQTADLKRIIYLGGLGDRNDNLSEHLRSRDEVLQILRSGPISVTALRAAMIIGSGSASFEILRYLVERLPLMITPAWVRTPCQPIAVRNVLNYLIGCLERDDTMGQVFDIGGPEILSYQQLMNIYAEEAGLHRRYVIPVPFFTPRLSSYWIHLVTPVPACIARPLTEGLRNPVVCTENRLRELVRQDLLDCRTAIRLALSCLQHRQVESHWNGVGDLRPAEWRYLEDPLWAGPNFEAKGKRPTQIKALGAKSR